MARISNVGGGSLSATNLKTINLTTLIGSGDIPVPYVGIASPASPIDGKLWWDTDDDTGTAGATIPSCLTFLATTATHSWTTMPAALTEYAGVVRHRKKFDLTNCSQARLVLHIITAGASGAEFRAQYSTDQSTWYYLDNSAGPALVLTNTGLIAGSWVNLDSGAKADVFLRIVGIDGDAIASPTWNQLDLQLK